MRPSRAIRAAASATYDAVVVGGGHNGLVAAAYLARAGLRVCVCERRHVIGGAAVTEELYPGFKYSRASYVYSLFRPHIVRDLGLEQRGLTLLRRSPSSFTPVHTHTHTQSNTHTNAQGLTLGAGAEADRASIAQFSRADAAAYDAFNAMLDRYAACFVPLLDAPPPDLSAIVDPHTHIRERMHNVRMLVRAGGHLAKLGRELPEFFEFLTSPAQKVLDRWFESDILKATLATDAVIGAQVSPRTPQSAYVLLHHVMCGAWYNVKGGMGALTQAVAAAAAARGVDIRTSTEIKRILCEDARDGLGVDADTPTPRSLDGARAPRKGKVVGVELMDGSTIRAPIIVANAAPQTALNSLLPPDAAAAFLPADVRTRMRNINVTTGSVKINVALDRLPNFLCAPNAGDGNTPMPHHRGTIHFETSMDQLEAAYADAVQGRPSQRPIIEMTIPTALDDSIAPPGKHIALLFVQYAPHTPASGPWTDATRNAFADNVFNVIEEYAPGFKESVLHRDILLPPDLERIFGLPGGNIFHAAMSLDQLFWVRPTAGLAQYRTPIQGLYLASAGTHPGGGVMGAAGHNAAIQILRDSNFSSSALRGISSAQSLA